jgi:hypothetical protein
MRPDHFKGFSAEQKADVEAMRKQQVEARNMAEEEEKQLGARMDDMTMHWNRIATLQESEVRVSLSPRAARARVPSERAWLCASARELQSDRALTDELASHAIPTPPPAACAGRAAPRGDAAAARRGQRDCRADIKTGVQHAIQRDVRQPRRRRFLQALWHLRALSSPSMNP